MGFDNPFTQAVVNTEDVSQWVSPNTWAGFVASANALSTDGGALYVPPGTYTVTEDYEIPAGVVPYIMPGAVFVQPWYALSAFTVASEETDPGTETIAIDATGYIVTSSSSWATVGETTLNRVRDTAGGVYITDVTSGERRLVVHALETTTATVNAAYTAVGTSGRDFKISGNWLNASANPTSHVQAGDIVGWGAVPTRGYLVCGRDASKIYLQEHPREAVAALTAINRAYRLTFTSGLVCGDYQAFTGPGVPKILGVSEINANWFGLYRTGAYNGATGDDDADGLQRATYAGSIHLGNTEVVIPPGKYNVNSTVSVASNLRGHVSQFNDANGSHFYSSISDRTPIFAVIRNSSDPDTGQGSYLHVGGLTISDTGDSLREQVGIIYSMPAGVLRDIKVGKIHIGVIFTRAFQSNALGIFANDCAYNVILGSALNNCDMDINGGGSPTTYNVYWMSRVESSWQGRARIVAQGGSGVTANESVYINGDGIVGYDIAIYAEGSEEVYLNGVERSKITIVSSDAKQYDLSRINNVDLTNVNWTTTPLVLPPVSGSNGYWGNDIDLPRYNCGRTADCLKKYRHATQTAHTPYAGTLNCIGDPHFRGLQNWNAVTYNNCTGALASSIEYGKQGRALVLTLSGARTTAYCALELSAAVVAWWQANKYYPLLAAWVNPSNAGATASVIDLSLEYNIGAGWVAWTGPTTETTAWADTTACYYFMAKWQLAAINSSGTLTGIRILLHTNRSAVDPGSGGITRWAGLYFGPLGGDIEKIAKGQWGYMPEAGRLGPNGGLIFPGTAAPTDTNSNYLAGARVANTAPGFGGWKELVCITAGSPGVWVPDYVLADVGSAKTADYNVEDDDIGTRFHNTGAAGTITGTLPAVADVAEGSCYHFTRTASQLHQIDPDGVEVIGAGGAGKYLSLDSDGASVTLMMAAGKWNVVRTYGTTSYET